MNLGSNNVRLRRTQDRNKDVEKNDPESFISLNDGSSSVSKIKYNKKNANISNTSSSVEMIYRNRKQTQKGLLTAAEEKKYGKLVQQLLKIQVAEQYLHINKKRQPTTLELASLFGMEELTFIQFRSVCEEARNRMMDSNLRLVISVAKKINQKKKEWTYMI